MSFEKTRFVRQTRACQRAWLTSTVVCLFAGVFTVVGGCRSQQAEWARDVVDLRIAYRQGTLADPVPIVLAETHPAGQHVRISLVPASGPADALNKLETGEADIAAGMPLDTLLERLLDTSRDVPNYSAYQVSPEVPGSAFLGIAVGPQAGASSLKDLAGKPIGVPPVRQAEYMLKRVLVAAGVPEKQVRIVNFNPLAAATGLRSGQYVGVYATEPFLSMVLDEGGKVIARGPTPEYLYDGRPLPVILSVVNNDFKSKHPRAFEEFLQLSREARQLIKSNPEQARMMFVKPKYGGFSEGVCRRLTFPETLEPNEQLKAAAERMVSDYVKDGLLRKKVDLSPFFPPGN